MIIKKNKKFVEGIADSQPNVSSDQKNDLEPISREIDLFDLDNIDFKQRQERRKGDRRRGFRRIDDRNLISRAREEAESIKEAASKEGYSRGLEQAKEDLEDLKDSLNVFFGAKQELFDEIAPDIMEISLDIAKKIIKKEASSSHDVILDTIKEVLKDLSKEEEKIMLKVNPSQISVLEQKIPEMIKTAGLEARVLIVPDENLIEGGCMVTTSNGVIDATIETQLEIISEALKVI